MLFFYLSMVETEEERDIVTRLYIAYEKMMYNIAFGILKNKQDAEDAVSETFIRIIRKYLDKVAEPESESSKAFVIVTVKSTATNLYRKRRRDAHVNLDELYDIGEDSLDMDFSRRCDAETVQKALGKVDESYREVLRYKYYYYISTAEIAEMLGITEDGVRKRLKRAEKSLMKIIMEEGL
jgi:RNA polymerase sigma-70 factor (ECF subfamily)